MFILTRSAQESVKIGDEVVVTIIAVRGNQVRLGFEAPKALRILRKEVYCRIQSEKTPDQI